MSMDLAKALERVQAMAKEIADRGDVAAYRPTAEALSLVVNAARLVLTLEAGHERMTAADLAAALERADGHEEYDPANAPVCQDVRRLVAEVLALLKVVTGPPQERVPGVRVDFSPAPDGKDSR